MDYERGPSDTALLAPPASAPGSAGRIARRPSCAATALWLLVTVGVLLRVRQWAAARSLWLDEVSIALNLQTRSYEDLVGELGGDQVAPVGWLWVERWVFVNVGFDERALRLLPLLFGCAALVVIALLARRVLSPVAAAFAVGLAAVSPILIRYSNELKQYSSDTFWVPLLALLTLRCLAAPGAWSTHLVWGLTGAVGLAFSHALLLALAGYGLVLLGMTFVRSRWRSGLGPVAAAGTIVLIAVAAVYVAQLQKVSGASTLDSFWTQVGGFPSAPVEISTVAHWLGGRALALPADPGRLEPAPVGLALLFVGAVVLALRNRTALLVLTAPVAVAVIAAALHVYPLAGRVSLYLVPLALVVIAAVVEMPSRFARVLLAVALLGLSLPHVLQGARAAIEPTKISETRGAVEYIKDHMRPDDSVFVYYTAGTSAKYYAPKAGVPYDGTLYLAGQHDETCLAQPAGPRLEGEPRVWALFGVHLSSAPLDEWDVLLAHLARHGRLLDAHEDTEAAAYLFDMTAPGTSDPSPLTQRPELDCLVIQPPPVFPAMP